MEPYPWALKSGFITPEHSIYGFHVCFQINIFTLKTISVFGCLDSWMVSHLTLNNGTLSLGLEIRLLSHPSIASMLFQDWKKRRFGSSVTRLGDYWMILVANVLTKVVQNVKNTLWAILKTSILKWKMSCLLFGTTYGLVGKLFIVAAGRTDWKHDL